jgi:hypothetical protein
MKSIEELEHQLKVAKEKSLICSYEHIMNKDYIMIHLRDDCTDDMKQKLKTHIRQNYRTVSFVTTTGHPNRCYMYVRYNDDGC